MTESPLQKKTITGLVSTILPVYNRPELIVEAVGSVLSQTYRPIEVIVVDDGSTDSTGEVLERLCGRHGDEMRVLHQQNGGPGRARETGRLTASGEYIQYLDSDDLLWPKKFEQQVAGLESHPECAVSYGWTRCYRLGETPVDVAHKRTAERVPTMFPSFLQSRWWDTATPLYRREIVDKAGGWTDLRNEEDWEYDCRIAGLGIGLHYCEAFVSDTRNGTVDQLSVVGNAPSKLKDRARAHALILDHARRFGLDRRVPEFQHFARELFLLARQCGAAGLGEESRRLFELAKSASDSDRRNGWDFRIYGALSEVLGWRFSGLLASLADRLKGAGTRV